MTLDNVLTLASTGLDSVSRRLAVVSQNVANANTPGYARESVNVSSATAGGVGTGVRTGLTTRSVDEHLQADVFASSALASGQQVKSDALSAIDAASGTPGSGNDLPGLLGTLRDGFSSLSGDPSNQTLQGLVASQAQALVRGVNGLAQTVATARQTAHDSAIDDVSAANAALRKVGDLSARITQATAQGESTADLEDQRDAGLQTVADLTGAKFLRQSNGDVLAVAGGLVLSLQSATGPFSLAPAGIGPTTTATGSPRLLLDGQDVTGQLTGGQLGAHLALRDSVLPGLQAGLDGFAQQLASQFDASGLTLFTDPVGAVPAAASPGFAQTIQVSTAVQATPTILRDGTAAAGAAGATGLIDTVLTQVLGAGAGSLTAHARDVTASQSSLAAKATSQLDTDRGVATSLTSKLATAVGVSVDSELANLVQLQKAYAANAKVLASTETVWTALLSAVQ